MKIKRLTTVAAAIIMAFSSMAVNVCADELQLYYRETSVVYDMRKSAELPQVTGVKVEGRTSDTSIKTDADICWDPVSGADGVQVFAVYSGGDKLLGTVPAARTRVRIKNIKAGSEVKIYLRAVKNTSSSAVCGANSKKVIIHCRPQTPTISLSASSNKITVNWKPTVGAQGYMIYMSDAKNGVYNRVTTKKSPSAKTATIKGLKSNKKYYFKVRAYKQVKNTKYYSEYSKIKSASTVSYVKLTKDAKMYSSAHFAPKAVKSLKAGKKVQYIGKSGNWCKIKTDSKTGWVYDLALGAKRTNSTPSAKNLTQKADDILFNIGTSPKAIANYVNTHIVYVTKSKGSSRDQMALYALKYGRGSCYHYACLSDYLLERAGYYHGIIKGRSGNGESNTHWWNIYKSSSSSGYRHLDACPFIAYSGIFYDYTDAKLHSARPGYQWDSSYPAAK